MARCLCMICYGITDPLEEALKDFGEEKSCIFSCPFLWMERWPRNIIYQVRWVVASSLADFSMACKEWDWNIVDQQDWGSDTKNIHLKIGVWNVHVNAHWWVPTTEEALNNQVSKRIYSVDISSLFPQPFQYLIYRHMVAGMKAMYMDCLSSSNYP